MQHVLIWLCTLSKFTFVTTIEKRSPPSKTHWRNVRFKGLYFKNRVKRVFIFCSAWVSYKLLINYVHSFQNNFPLGLAFNTAVNIL